MESRVVLERRWGAVLLICLFCVDGVVVGWAWRAAVRLFRWRRGAGWALGEVERLYREGRVEEALVLADRLAERDPGAAWDLFIIKAAKAKDLEERSFWVVAASRAARRFGPLRFLPVRRWFKDLGTVAFGIAAGYVEPVRAGRGFVFKIGRRLKTIGEVEHVEEIQP